MSLPNSNNLTQDEILNQYISNPNFIGSLGSPTRIILSNPSSKEEIIIDLKPGNTWIERLLDATITGVAHAQSLPTKTPPPLTEIPPTSIPRPTERPPATPLPPATATKIPIKTYSIEELNAMSSADKLAMAPQVGTAPADVVASFLPKGADVADITWGEKSLTYWERVVSYHGKAGGQEVTLYYDLESGHWAKKYDSFESLSQIPADQVPDVMVLGLGGELGDRLIRNKLQYNYDWISQPQAVTADGKQIFRDEKSYPKAVFDTVNQKWLTPEQADVNVTWEKWKEFF